MSSVLHWMVLGEFMEGGGVPNVCLRGRWWIAQVKSDEFSSSSAVVFEFGFHCAIERVSWLPLSQCS